MQCPKPPCEFCDNACCRKWASDPVIVEMYEEDAAKLVESKYIEQLNGHRLYGLYAHGSKCPYLIEHACYVYADRPANCRRFNCLAAYLIWEDCHGAFLRTHPRVVTLIERLRPEWVVHRQAEAKQRQAARRA